METLDLLEKLQKGKGVKNVLNLGFDLKQFMGRMDMDRLAMVGHSFGGSSALAAINIDSRFR